MLFVRGRAQGRGRELELEGRQKLLGSGKAAGRDQRVGAALVLPTEEQSANLTCGPE